MEPNTPTSGNSVQLSLQIFQYEGQTRIRTIQIDGEPWFYAIDVCGALGILNSRDAISTLDQDDVGKTDATDGLGRKASFSIVNESGLYNLVFRSGKESAKKFKRWVTHEVLPQLRRTGSFALPGARTPIFVRRFNDNWDRVDRGFFSVISELYIRFCGRLEQEGHILADKSPDGREIRPDVSVGKTFPTWLKKHYPLKADYYKMYSHILPDGMTVDARQYRNDMLPIFIEFIEEEWIPNHAQAYLETRDRRALDYLPKLLPPARKSRPPPRP